MPDPIETYPPSRTTASVTKGWRIADLNYFLSQQIVIVPLLWSLMPSQEQSRCMRWPMGYLEAMRQDVLHACSHGIYCFKKHLPTLPSSAIPNRSFLTSFLYAPFVGWSLTVLLDDSWGWSNNMAVSLRVLLFLVECLSLLAQIPSFTSWFPLSLLPFFLSLFPEGFFFPLSLSFSLILFGRLFIFALNWTWNE